MASVVLTTGRDKVLFARDSAVDSGFVQTKQRSMGVEGGGEEEARMGLVLQKLPGEGRGFCLPACPAFTNTSYPCEWKITALKIKYNPFAKAFLDAKER